MMASIPESFNLALRHHQAGRLQEAEAGYRHILQSQPHHSDALHLLGVIAHQQGRDDVAIEHISKAIALNPAVAEYHNNLGNALQTVGKPDEALPHFRQALALKPEYAEAHGNLANLLMRQGKLDEAILCFRQALRFKPDVPVVHHNLGNALKSRGQAEEALDHYLQAITSQPGYSEAINDYVWALFDTRNYQRLTMAIDVLKNDRLVDPNQLKGLYILKAILCYLQCDFNGCYGNLALGEVEINSPAQFPNCKELAVFRLYLARLLDFFDSHREMYETKSDVCGDCWIIGDSHSLAPAWTNVMINGRIRRVVPYFITGCKAWHLAMPRDNSFKQMLQAAYAQVPESASMIFAVGEIDCRLNEGILPFCKRHPDQRLSDIIRNTVDGYVAHIAGLMPPERKRFFIQGVPAPRMDVVRHGGQDGELLVRIVKEFNEALATAASRYRCTFIDVYRMTARLDGIAEGADHIDHYHLKPDYLGKALSQYLVAP
nr:tetratricopeptide repeat protein [Nitrospirota bacterium]